jgi:hypothetical protein
MSTTKAHIHARWESYDKTWTYSTHSCDMTGYGYIYLMAQDIQFVSPADKELKQLLIDNLRAEQVKITSEAYVKKEQLEGQIQSLLALEDKSGVPDEI